MPARGWSGLLPAQALIAARTRRMRLRHLPLLAVTVPAVALVVVFYILPNVLNLLLALTDWSSTRPSPSFVGLRNLQELAEDSTLSNTLSTTILFAVIVMVAENVVALALALALVEPTRFNVAMRVIFFIPVLVSPLAAGYVFLGMLHTDGALNALLASTAALVGVTAPRPEWLGSTTWTLVVVALVHAWKYGGIHMLVYLAGLKAIPQEVLEASRMDGATRWQTFRHVRLPLLGPALTFNVTLTLIGALAAFDLILAMTKGGPARATEVMNLVVFRVFGTGRFSDATALSLVLLVVVALAAIPLIVTLRRREVDL